MGVEGAEDNCNCAAIYCIHGRLLPDTAHIKDLEHRGASWCQHSTQDGASLTQGYS